MIVRPSMQSDLARCNLSDGTLFYSLWEGYRDSTSQQAFEAWVEARGIRLTPLHTSGHARIEDIRRVIDRLEPKRIIPIHTMAPDAFLDYSDRVDVQTDGVPFEI